MSTETKVQPARRKVTGRIQSIAEKEGARGRYHAVSLAPRPGMKFPDTYNVFAVELIGSFKAGDHVEVLLQRGNAKHDGATLARFADWYWDVVSIAPAGAGSTAVGGTEDPAHEIEDLFPPEGSDKGQAASGEPWYRFIAWGDLVREARLMALDLPATTPPSALPYSKRFQQALGLICISIREEMAKP